MIVAVATVRLVGVYVPVITIACLLTLLLAIAGYHFRKTPGGEWFAAAMGLCAIWSLAALLTVLTDDANLLAVCELIMQGCAVTVPVAWFSFVASYVGFERLLGRLQIGLLFLPSMAGLLAMLAWPHTTLYFSDIERVTLTNGITVVNAPSGPLAYVLLLYLFGLFVIGIGLICRLLIVEGNLFSGQAIWLLVGSFPPVVAALLEPMGLVGSVRLPYTPIGFALMGVAYGYGLFSHRVFDLSPGTWRIGADRAFDGLNESVIIVDAGGDVLGCNQSACERFGWTKQSVFGRDIRTLEPGLAAARNRDQPTEFTHNGVRYEVTTSIIDDIWGRDIGDALVVRDVTDRYERRQQLQVLNRVLRHNVRNNTTVIQGRAESLLEQYDEDNVRAIVRNAEELSEMAEKARLIDKQLDRSESTYQEIELREFLEEIVANARQTAGDGPVSVDVPGSLTIRADRIVLELVVSNLVENAIEHGTPGRDAAVRTPVRVRAERTADGVLIEVGDDGPGIPEAELAVVRDGAETPLEHGTGLGLWLITWGATWLDAELTVRTDEGTTVRLLVPE